MSDATEFLDRFFATPPPETAETIQARVVVEHHAGPTWGDGAWGVDLGDNDNGWGFDGEGEAIHFHTVYRAVLADLLDRVVRAERERIAGELTERANGHATQAARMGFITERAILEAKAGVLRKEAARLRGAK